ncbi:hypothetical protein [Bradyrhizobium cenepequi]
MSTSNLPAIAGLALLLTTPALAQGAAPGRVKIWPNDGNWLTELRRDADGSHACVTGAPFNSPHTFVLEFASRPGFFALMLVDQTDPVRAADDGFA